MLHLNAQDFHFGLHAIFSPKERVLFSILAPQFLSLFLFILLGELRESHVMDDLVERVRIIARVVDRDPFHPYLGLFIYFFPFMV